MIKPDFEKCGMLPAIVQDDKTLEVLMLAYMNDEAYQLTVDTGYAHYYSRSRKKIWKKGESSGHLQEVIEIRIDCDNDTILLIVNQIGGAACHTGYKSCFFRKFSEGDYVVDGNLIFDPRKVYGND